MNDWLYERIWLVRNEETPGEKPQAGEGRITKYSESDGVGVVELESGRVVAFGNPTDSAIGEPPEVGTKVYVDEIFRHEKFGWSAGEVVTVESDEAQEPEPEQEEEDDWSPPPPDFPAVEEVHAQIEELTQLHPGFAHVASPSVFLRPTPEKCTTRTHFQGCPLVPSGFEWPESASRSTPMRFIGQIDFAELPELDEGVVGLLPEQGVLALFADPEMWQAPDDEAYWELVYLSAPEDGERLEPPAESLDRPAVGVEFEVYPSLPGAFDRYYVPSPGPDDDPGLRHEIEDALWDFAEESSPSPRHHVGGHVEWIQYDMREWCEKKRRAADEGTSPDEIGEVSEEAAKRWRLLWAVDSDPHTHGDLFWGDCGRLYLMIREDDLREGRFDRVQPSVQCY